MDYILLVKLCGLSILVGALIISIPMLIFYSMLKNEMEELKLILVAFITDNLNIEYYNAEDEQENDNQDDNEEK